MKMVHSFAKLIVKLGIKLSVELEDSSQPSYKELHVKLVQSYAKLTSKLKNGLSEDLEDSSQPSYKELHTKIENIACIKARCSLSRFSSVDNI